MSPWGKAQPSSAPKSYTSLGLSGLASCTMSCRGAAWISSSRVQSLVANTGYMTFCSTCPLLAIKKTAGLTHFHIESEKWSQSLSLFFIPCMVLPKMDFQKLWLWKTVTPKHSFSVKSKNMGCLLISAIDQASLKCSTFRRTYSKFWNPPRELPNLCIDLYQALTLIHVTTKTVESLNRSSSLLSTCEAVSATLPH